MARYEFRFHKDYRDAIVCNSIDELRQELRQWAPCTTVFRAIHHGLGDYTILRLSPYLIGPDIEGYLHISE